MRIKCKCKVSNLCNVNRTMKYNISKFYYYEVDNNDNYYNCRVYEDEDSETSIDMFNWTYFDSLFEYLRFVRKKKLNIIKEIENGEEKS